MEKMKQRTYRSTEKENLKVIKSAKKHKISEAKVIRNLINENL